MVMLHSTNEYLVPWYNKGEGGGLVYNFRYIFWIIVIEKTFGSKEL